MSTNISLLRNVKVVLNKATGQCLRNFSSPTQRLLLNVYMKPHVRVLQAKVSFTNIWGKNVGIIANSFDLRTAEK